MPSTNVTATEAQLAAACIAAYNRLLSTMDDQWATHNYQHVCAAQNSALDADGLTVPADGGVDVGRDDVPGDEMDMSLLSERVAQLDGTAEVGRSDDGGVTAPAWVSV